MDTTTTYRLAKMRMAELHAEAAANRLASGAAKAKKELSEDCGPSLFRRMFQMPSIRLARRIGLFTPRPTTADCV